MSTDKYAMYLRKSRADLELEALGEGETLARHQKILFDLAARHDISTDQITIYREVVSGDSLSDRVEMQRLLSDVYLKKYKGVLVVEIERLARGNTKDQGEVADAFQYSHTHIITPAKVYDPDNEFDQEYFEFGLFMSRREYKTIRRRLEAGKTQAATEGNFILSKRIFGYDIVRPSKKDRYLVIRPDEAKIVQMIFDWYTKDNWTTYQIAQELTKMGVPTLHNKPDWNRGSIRDMLSNLHYTGKVVWNSKRTIRVPDPRTGQLKKKRVPVPREEWIVVDGKHKAIISQEQFDLAQPKKKEKLPVPFEQKIVNPLAGLVFCSDCGMRLRYQKGLRGRESRLIHPYEVASCKKRSACLNIVISALIETLKAHIADFEFKMQNDYHADEVARHQEKIKTMESELAKIEGKKRRLFDSWEADDGMYTRDEFIERKNMYTQQIESLKAQITEAKKETPETIDYSAKITTIHSIIDCILDPSIDGDDKNYFLRQFIDKILYDIDTQGKAKGGKVILDVYFK